MAGNNELAFWLQVRKDYVLENFTNLITYLRAYNYNPQEQNPDYLSTLEAMTELSEDYGKPLRDEPFYLPLPPETADNRIACLFGATILASNKAGQTPTNVILSLAALISRSKTSIEESVNEGLFRIVTECLRGSRLNSAGFTWNDIADPKTFNLAIFALKFRQMKFVHDPETSPYFLENKGLLVIPPLGPVEISTTNRHNYCHKKLEPQILLPGLLSIMVPKEEAEKTADFESHYKMTTRLLSSQDSMKPSPKVTLHRYTKNDTFPVRIITKAGKLLRAETIDSKYERIEGKVLLNLPARRGHSNILSNLLNEGDYLLVSLSPEKDYTFETYDAFEDFYREYACECAGEKYKAIYAGAFAAGTEWVTENGIHVGIATQKINELTDDQRQVFNAALSDGEAIEVKLYDNPPDRYKEDFNVYAEPCGLFQFLPEEEQFSEEEAISYLMEEFIHISSEAAGEVRQADQREYRKANPEECAVLIPVLHRFIDDGLSSCRLRLEYATAAAMLCKICGRTREYEFIDHERRFLYSQVQFAANRDPIPLPRVPALEDVEEIKNREKIISTLIQYRKKQPTEKGPLLTAGMTENEESVSEKVEALVNASNSLIGIIDTLELNNIQQAIARSLSIEDEYVSILDDRTFYGTESINLEFKTSAVFPPANRRRMASAIADPELQKWALIRTVCGFLNSRGGGDLLLGVNDAGYAVGLDDDIKKLYEMKEISARDIDHYRTYLQQIFDRAFKAKEGGVAPQDIARPNIEYILENNVEGKAIMRIKVKPFPKKIVMLAAPASERPAGIDDCFVRRSGRTVTASQAMQDEIMKYK